MSKTSGLRVLMLLENCPYPQDGRVRHEAATLLAAGYRVSIICPATKGQARHESVDGVNVYRFPALMANGGLLGYLWEYTYSVAAMFVFSLVVFVRGGFDVIHAHNPPDTLALIAACYKVLGKHFIYDQHDLSPEMYQARFADRAHPFLRSILLGFEKISYRLADHVIVTNESYRAIGIERGRVPENRITIVRNGPDPEQWREVTSPPDLRQRAGTIIGYAGTIGPQDGVDYLLRAVAHLVYTLKKTDVLCLIIGQGDAVPRLKAVSAELNLTPYVEFTGWLSGEKLLGYLSTIDLGVEPAPSNSYNDRSTTIKLMEYMALEKPVVAFDLPEHRFTAQDAAIYAIPNDELDFARQIAALMEDAERRAAMGQRGKARINAELAWPCQVRSLLQVYTSLKLPGPTILIEDDYETES
jgi:glycosyltransferase involved in cell wall biosynthesis